jgi:hypothetical protein
MMRCHATSKTLLLRLTAIARKQAWRRGEFRSWRESLVHMARVLPDDEIPVFGRCHRIQDSADEQTYRLHCLIVTELDDTNSSKAIIVELKDSSIAERTQKDGIALARRGERTGEVEGPHLDLTFSTKRERMPPCSKRSTLPSDVTDAHAAPIPALFSIGH